LAGIVLGPHTPLQMITDQERIMDLAQVGLVFVMFAIGLHLSLSKLARMGLPTILATGLGAVFMFALTLLLGQAMGWSYKQSLFLAAMMMVSSSAVIAKVMEELHLTHNKTAQMALGITVCEDIVAVVMLTVLATVGGSAATGAVGAAPAAVEVVTATAGMEGVVSGVEDIGSVFTKIGSYVILVLAACLLFVPRLMKRLDMSGDPELRNVGIAGVLLILAFFAERAGFSLALGAFLFGAIIAELPQKELIEKSFDSVRSLFSSLFFVSIGMMANPSALLDWQVSGLALVLVLFAVVGRPIACEFALILTGSPPSEARRAALLLMPIGEFSFIIAQAAILAGVFPDYLYPVAISLSVFTVLLTPIISRFAEPILRISRKLTPPVITGALDAYHDWISTVKNSSPSRPAWKLARPRLLQIGGEMLLVTGIMAFSKPVLGVFTTLASKAAARWGESFQWLASGLVVEGIFWSLIGVVVLMFCVSIGRNVIPVSTILARSIEGPMLPRKLLELGFRVAAVALSLLWLFSILPAEWKRVTLSARILLILTAIGVVAFFFRKLIYWHSAWRAALEDVFTTGTAETNIPQAVRRDISGALEPWDIHLQDCVIPENASCAGEALSALAIPVRFGVSVMEIERNGYNILSPGPETHLYPGDKALLLGRTEEIAKARAFLGAKGGMGAPEDSRHAVLEDFVVGDVPCAGHTFAQLGIAKNAGVRVVGIQRAGRRITNPSGSETLQKGDGLLLMGSAEQIRIFPKWLQALAI
jgi:CPA2 family monovalent cation:H+ antiporter-2